MNTEKTVRHYFVDEAGDGILFDRKGRVVIGAEGCSNYFILGVADIAHPDALSDDLAALRNSLIADPYFTRVPSMQPVAKKTALAFHAKDDLPEVRREVFTRLLRHDVRFLAVVRNKHQVLEYVRQRNERDAAYRYQPNELYDYLVRRLFKNLLHKDDAYQITFAKRGASDRTEALKHALEMARQRFDAQWGGTSNATIHVLPRASAEVGCLQAVDYFLWALQRLYERREDRYIQFVWDKVRLVHDLDDTRADKYGVFYTQKKPLTLAALPDLPGI
ncbi:MAG: DUF3800 domain-containing protein [Chloroflexi bacterium]|nr:DUF3800 domain-containing protein [Chloroflexota bacterium]